MRNGHQKMGVNTLEIEDLLSGWFCWKMVGEDIWWQRLIKFCSGLVTLMPRDFVRGSSRVNIIDKRDKASEVNLKNTRCYQWHNLIKTLSIVREVLGEVALVPCKNIEKLNWILFVIMDNISYLSKNNPTLTLF